MQKDPSRRRFPLPDRVIEVVDDTLTGEVLLDEALKMMKASEKMSVSSWIDLMSGAYAVGLEIRIQTPGWDSCSWCRAADLCSGFRRRDVEPHEDRLPAEAGP